MKEPERIENIGKDDFLDEEGSRVAIQTIRSGRGRVARGSGKKEPFMADLLCGPDGQLGWRVSLPGSRTLPTPAVARGSVFTGGGFGSYEFYTFDQQTGRLKWKVRTADDGPTAATIAGDYVAFNTESCTVYVVDVATGRVVWKEWLGDPLMAQTAISGSTLFMVYPDRRRKHQLAAFDLKRGKRKWTQKLIADVISAPIVIDDSVYAATIDGTVYRVDADSGEVHWSLPHKATSAPWIHRGKVYMSLREEARGKEGLFSTEGYDTVTITRGIRENRKSSSRRRADYFKLKAKAHAFFAGQDASVGFGSAPSAAKLHMAREHLGTGHVASVWSFAGSRPEVFDDGIFCVLDDVVQRLDLGTKKPLWRVRVESDEESLSPRTLSPPAVSAARLYVTSSLGDLFVLDRESGKELWALNVGSPILSQPALAGGKVFLGTADGALYGFETGDPDPRSWSMWGGGPGHNG